MQQAQGAIHPGEEAPGAGRGGVLRLFVFGLFFMFGGVTSLNDVVIPKLKALFTLSYAEAMLVQSAFFAAYLMISIPASMLVKRIGYMPGAALGLLAMMAGCLLFIPAAAAAVFPAFLTALFVLASGVTLVQVVANPLISLLGPARTAPSRLTFAQAFNSLGTTIFPYLGAVLIFGGLAAADPVRLSGAALAAFRTREGAVVARAYLGLAVALGLGAALVFMQRGRLKEAVAERTRLKGLIEVLQRPRFALGALCTFLYVGAEVAIGSLIVSFLVQTSVLGVSEGDASRHVSLYWGGAMVGRFIGAWLLRRTAPGHLLAACCAGAAALLLIAATATGAVSGYALLAIGLCNAIMFPTIFSLACEGLGDKAPDGSGVICMAIFGGAVIPPLTGHAADLAGLRAALCIPGLCYLAILLFGLYAERTRALTLAAGAAPA
jgi:FHS family L-fucose permease-like MFS transporter